jgi:FAD/FMN-containing dehydrogenase
MSIDLVDPQGSQVHADAQEDPDLFWECRGGGGGTFGIATGYELRLIPLTNVLIFNIKSPPLSLARAAAIMKEWQAWAPQAPRTIDSNLVITRHSNSLLDVRCAGQSVGTSQELRRELKFLSSAPPVPMSYLKAVNYFAGPGVFHLRPDDGKLAPANVKTVWHGILQSTLKADDLKKLGPDT